MAENWKYDPTGNWYGYRVEADGAVTLEQARAHDKGNRLMQIKGETQPFELDRVGRMTQAVSDASGNWDEPLKFKWDAWNRLTEVRRASNDTVLAQYAYDGLTRRITREVESVVHHTYFSGQWKPLEERKDSATTPSAQYLWGARHRDDLVRRDRDSDDSGTLDEKRYVLMDYYSPAAITDEEGTVTERYDFSVFGMRSILAPDFSPRSTSECMFAFGFQGQFLDAESGLMNYGYRYYSPYLGRWLCKDPIGEIGGTNLYRADDNNPVNVLDFYGLCQIEVVIGHGDPYGGSKTGPNYPKDPLDVNSNKYGEGKDNKSCIYVGCAGNLLNKDGLGKDLTKNNTANPDDYASKGKTSKDYMRASELAARAKEAIETARKKAKERCKNSTCDKITIVVTCLTSGEPVKDVLKVTGDDGLCGMKEDIPCKKKTCEESSESPDALA